MSKITITASDGKKNTLRGSHDQKTGTSGFRRGIIVVMMAVAVGMAVFSGMVHASEIKIKKFNIEKETTSFVKDREGFLWVGTINGELIRFDGFDQTVYSLKGGGHIPCMIEDNTGRLWAVSDTLGFVRYDKKSDTVTVFGKDKGLSSNSFNYASSLLSADKKGNIWIATKGGLNMFDPRTEKFTAYRHDPSNPKSLSHDDVDAVTTDSKGMVWAGTKDGLTRLDPETVMITVYRHDPANPVLPIVVSSVLADENILWLGSDSGRLTRFDPESGKSVVYTITDKIAQMNRLLKYKDNIIVMTYLGHTVYQFDPSNGQFSPFIKGITAHSLYYYENDGLWGTDVSSIFREDNPKFTAFPVDPKNPDVLKDEGVFPMWADRDGFIWFGYVKEGLGKYDPRTNKVTNYGYGADETKASHNYVCGVYEDGEGRIWAGTFGGVGIFDKKLDRFVKQDPRLKQMYTMSQDIHDPNIMWLAGYEFGLWKYDGKAGEPLRNYLHKDDMPNTPAGNSTFSMVQEKDTGILWIAYFDGGVSRFDPSAEKFVNFSNNPNDPNSLSNNAVNSVYQDSKGNIWAATNYGLNRIDRQTFEIKRFTKENGFPANNAFCMEEGNGFLWVSTEQGIFKFNPSSEKVEKVYTKDDGIASHAFFGSSHAKSADGRIYFGGYKGLSAFYPDKMTENPRQPPVALKSLTQAGERVSPETGSDQVKTIFLPWNKNFFEFEYVALDYTNQEKNQYMYILEGWDKDWYNAGHQRKGRYSGINGGEYFLRIRGSNNDGVWCRPDQEVALKVVAGTPFWKTWWFLSLIGIFIAAVAGIFFTQRMAYLKHEHKIEQEKALLKNEMELARKIQTALLPQLADSFHPEFEIASSMLPADEVGGDFYDITYDRTANLWFAIGDVSGHGVTPGLIMMMAQTVHATVMANIDCDARGTVIRINEILYRNVHERLKETHFMTLTALKHMGNGKFQHAGAHLRIVVYRRKADQCELIVTKGVYLNLKKDISNAVKNSEFEMGAGDVMVLYTDGLTEAENQAGEILGVNRFAEIVKKYARIEPKAMKENIVADVIRWCDNIRKDDMTILIVKRKGGSDE